MRSRFPSMSESNVLHTPNGTTFAGLQRMTARDFRGLIQETVLAATARSQELSKDC